MKHFSEAFSSEKGYNMTDDELFELFNSAMFDVADAHNISWITLMSDTRSSMVAHEICKRLEIKRGVLEAYDNNIGIAYDKWLNKIYADI